MGGPEPQRCPGVGARAPAQGRRWACGPGLSTRFAGEPVLIDVLISDGEVDAAWEAAEARERDAVAAAGRRGGDGSPG